MRRHPIQHRKLRTGVARWTPEQIYIANGWLSEPEPTCETCGEYLEDEAATQCAVCLTDGRYPGDDWNDKD